MKLTQKIEKCCIHCINQTSLKEFIEAEKIISRDEGFENGANSWKTVKEQLNDARQLLFEKLIKEIEKESPDWVERKIIEFADKVCRGDERIYIRKGMQELIKNIINLIKKELKL